MSLGDPNRVRTAVRDRGNHIGYVTVVTYPDRDLLHYSAGSPYSEIVVSDLNDGHVALLQEFKEHWLVHCGSAYETTSGSGRLKSARVMALAVFALQNSDRSAPVLSKLLKAQVDRALG
ncbi:MAG: hypothetical protein J0I06_06345 [Planctomycetes bacterium]|nr:hypothetical protein [Planctomycetota bacterium]